MDEVAMEETPVNVLGCESCDKTFNVIAINLSFSKLKTNNLHSINLTNINKGD